MGRRVVGLRGARLQVGRAESAAGRVCGNLALAARALFGGRLGLRRPLVTRLELRVGDHDEEVENCGDDDERDQRIDEVPVQELAVVDREIQAREVRLAKQGGDEGGDDVLESRKVLKPLAIPLSLRLRLSYATGGSGLQTSYALAWRRRRRFRLHSRSIRCFLGAGHSSLEVGLANWASARLRRMSSKTWPPLKSRVPWLTFAWVTPCPRKVPGELDPWNELQGGAHLDATHMRS